VAPGSKPPGVVGCTGVGWRVNAKVPGIYAARAFSSEVDTGSRQENASKQKIRARF
jgi:hypothetical protein